MHAGEILFGVVEENGGREVSSTLKPGQSVNVPKGLIHFEQNLGCDQAQFIAFFPHRDPGTQTTISSFFKLPKSAIRQTLGVDDAAIEQLRKAVEATPDLSIDPECAKRCGIKSARRMM
jgi:oxalate decarboxylase/phosphoglucose isomerase-like protein (cupin superfamily)